jgi:hypothetical protein
MTLKVRLGEHRITSVVNTAVDDTIFKFIEMFMSKPSDEAMMVTVSFEGSAEAPGGQRKPNTRRHHLTFLFWNGDRIMSVFTNLSKGSVWDAHQMKWRFLANGAEHHWQTPVISALDDVYLNLLKMYPAETRQLHATVLSPRFFLTDIRYERFCKPGKAVEIKLGLESRRKVAEW